jgi:predicted enzyme related to lactoylglutathione lyase
LIARRIIVRQIMVAGLLALLAGCATVTINLPAVTEAPTDQRLAGKVVWHDLITSRPEDAKRFYGELFGWEFQELGLNLGFGNTLNYTLIRHEGQLIGGMVDARRLDAVPVEDADRISQWVMLMSVDDVDAAAASVRESGGKVLTPPTDFVDRGRLTLVEDAQGATLALLETRDGDPPDRPAVIGGFLWDELWTTDLDSAERFYRGLAPFEPGERSLASGQSYRYLSTDGQPRVGLLPRPVTDIEPVWVSYLRVADASTIVARVPELGGRVLAPPQPRAVGGEVALIADPSGAGIAIQTWTPPEQRAASEK